MRIVHSIAELQERLAAYRRPVLVPALGRVHAGHRALIEQARPLGDVTVASVFVHRMRLLRHADLATGPGALEAAATQLAAAGCDILFAPGERELHPESQSFKVVPDRQLAGILEGQFRPNVFTGVCTVALKLFQCVQPRVAVFGKGDYQQLLVLGRMVREFGLPVAIVAGETPRAPDGLALASCNGQLSAAQRKEALQLPRALARLARRARAGEDLAAIEAEEMEGLWRRGWRPDYLAVRRRSDLRQPADGDDLVAVGAARLGAIRLMDSREF